MPLLREVAEELEVGAEDSLLKARQRLVTLPDAATLLAEDRKELFVAYVLNKIIKDIWANLGTDAMFDFPDDEAMRVLAQSLAQFVHGATSGKEEDLQKAFVGAADAVSAYYGLVSEYEAKAQRGELPEIEGEVGE